MTKAMGSRTKVSRLVRVRVITAAAEPPGRWAVRAGASTCDAACGAAAVVMGLRCETSTGDRDVHPVQRGHGVLPAAEDPGQGTSRDDRVVDRSVLDQAGAPATMRTSFLTLPPRIGLLGVSREETVTIPHMPSHGGSVSQAPPMPVAAYSLDSHNT